MEVKIALAGVGNLCSALVQGIMYYSKNSDSTGLSFNKLGPYTVDDIKIVAAFDIDSSKVGKDLSQAIFSRKNTAPKFIEVEEMGVDVLMGPHPDEIEDSSLSQIEISRLEPADLEQVLSDCDADILVNLISGGSDRASTNYAEACLETGVSFLNATPSLIASVPSWSNKFDDVGLPLAGDDLLDQMGATVIHMGLLELLHRRGVKIDESYQLDVGGGTESINTLEKTRETKRRIKTKAVSSTVPYSFPLVSGSTDFVDFLENSRDSFFWLRGRYFCGASFTMDVKLNTIDSANGGAILLDTIRGLKIAQEKGLSGSIKPVCNYGFKTGKRTRLNDVVKDFQEFALAK